MVADVKFNSDRWREMRSGLGHLVGAGWFSEGIGDCLKDVAENFQDIEEEIHRLDSDGVVRFSHTNKSSKYKELQEDLKVLYDFTNKVDEMIEEEIDQPFYEDMDEVAVMMRDLSIHNYTTKNRIGATEIKISSTGAYGANGIQTEEVLKKDITITDLLNGKNPYAEDMKKKYKAFQKANPDAEFTYKEFQKVALQTRAFQYKSIEDGQLKNEMWRDIIIGAGILVVGVFCPPAGIALGVTYGALELGTAVSGKDWGTGRKLDDAERAMRGSFALLEIIPGVKAVSSFTKTVRASDTLLNAGQITKNSVKIGTNKMIAETAMNLKHTKNLVTSTVKNAETRIKSVHKQLDNLAKISEEKLKQQAFKTADSVDRLVTNMKNINLNPIEDVAFAGVGRLNSSVENTHTIRDMVSKIVKSSEKEINFGGGVKGTGESKGTLDTKLENYVCDSFEGTGKEVQDKFNRYLRENVWCDETLSNVEKIEIMKVNFNKLSPEQKENFNVLNDVRVLKNPDYSNWGEWPEVDWPSFPGLNKDTAFSVFDKESGEILIPIELDRIGSPYGSNLGVVENGYHCTQIERSICYIENEYARNNYSFDKMYYKDAIDTIKDFNIDNVEESVNKINSIIDQLNMKNGTSNPHVTENAIANWYSQFRAFQSNPELVALCDERGIESIYGVIGEAAPWIKNGEVITSGGAGQLNIPINVKALEEIGILQYKGGW